MPPDSCAGLAFSKPFRPTSSIISSHVGLVDRAPGDLERQADVRQHAAPRQQRGVLERDAELVRLAQLRRRLAVDADRAAGRRLEAGEDAQDRRLAAARRAEQREERALVGVQVRVLAAPRRSCAPEREDLGQAGDLQAGAQGLALDTGIGSARRCRSLRHDRMPRQPAYVDQVGVLLVDLFEEREVEQLVGLERRCRRRRALDRLLPAARRRS